MAASVFLFVFMLICVSESIFFCIFAAPNIIEIMRKTTIIMTLAVVLAAACGSHERHVPADDETIGQHKSLPGDSMLYGLACDGCSDSVLVLLPYGAENLDTFDIIDAFQQHRIYGMPHVGDEIAVIVNPQDSEEVLTVVNLETLKGTWCYMVTPTLRHANDMPERMRRRMTTGMHDSVRRQLFAPREYVLRLKRDYTAMASGGGHGTSANNMSPVAFPPVRHYTEWHLYNGRLVLKADTIKGLTTEGAEPVVDTAEICLLMRDSLVLRFADGERCYYRQRQTASE